MPRNERALIEEMQQDLRAGLTPCRDYLAALDPLRRSELYTQLLFERLERKMKLTTELYEEAGGNWQQLFYLLYFRTLGDRKNQAAYLDLARRVPYRYLLRERLSPRTIEAMLFGASGLLERFPSDPYIEQLRTEFDHLAAKYGIAPMAYTRWQLHEVRPANHPVLRIAQAVAFFCQDDSVMERALACHDERSIRQLFCIEAVPYWQRQQMAEGEADDRPKRLGHFKAHMLGINLVAVLQFAYGSLANREEYCTKAIRLLEKLPAEDNRYMRLWQAEGITPRDAFESQALLQLITEHCVMKGCGQCLVANQLLRERLRKEGR